MSADLTVGTPGWAPLKMEVRLGAARRWEGRGGEVIDAVLKCVPLEQLEERLEASPQVDVLLARSVLGAAGTALAAKRRLLGKLVVSAVLDDAEIDEAGLLIAALEGIEGPHARCLEAVARAEEEAAAEGEMAPVARGASQQINDRVNRAGQGYPAPVLVTLERLGLLDATVGWDGVALVSGLTRFGRIVIEDLRGAGLADDLQLRA